MRTRILLLLSILVMMINCREKQGATRTGSGDARFQKISDEFIAGYLHWRPINAVNLGFHEYDGRISDYSKKSVEGELSRLKKFDSLLAGFDTNSLSRGMQYDYQILQCGLRSELFDMEEMETYSKNPMIYAGAINIIIYVNRNFAPLKDRLKSIIAIERQAPSVFRAARENLSDSLAQPYIETAIQIATGTADFLKNDLVKALKDLRNDSVWTAFNQVNLGAIAELRAYADYLEKVKLPKAHTHFAIGKEKYRKMLKYGEGVFMDPDTILEIGMTELNREKEVFDRTAKSVDPGESSLAVFRKLQSEHPSSASLISDVSGDVDNIRQFIIDKKIVTISPEKTLEVKETPEFERSVSEASIDTPGPFEKKATESYYYITPVNPSWTRKQQEGWLSGFNPYTASLISIHEAYPGHYTQFLHLKESSATKIEKIFGSYAFIEGWAHYAEKMMIEEGYGNTGDSVKAAKFHLAQLNESLLRLCRLCVSIQMHCRGMSVSEATRFFLDNMHVDGKEAEQEANRGTYDAGYLYYSLGKMMLLKLRDDYKNQEGNDFSLQKFNDLVLDNGMPPVPVLRQRLLKDKNSWAKIL